jgi:hypothetical protein
MDTNFFAVSAMLLLTVVAAVPAANVIHAWRHACLYRSINCHCVLRAIETAITGSQTPVSRSLLTANDETVVAAADSAASLV